jgi:anti-sigma factor RsiW
MEHPGELELLEWRVGRLPADRAVSVEAHVAECDACRRAADRLAGAWGAMDALDPAPAGRDQWAAIDARLDREPQRTPSWLGVALRAAAAVVVAAAVGHWAAGWARPVPATTEGAVIDALHLAVLSNETPAGLGETILELGEPSAEASGGQESVQ